MALHERTTSLGGIVQVVRGDARVDTEVALPAIQRRIKAAFDHADILAPQR